MFAFLLLLNQLSRNQIVDTFDFGRTIPLIISSQRSLALTLYHVDVVGSIPDGQCHGFLVLLDQTHHIGLLLGCNTTADDRFTLTGHVHKVNLWRRRCSS